MPPHAAGHNLHVLNLVHQLQLLNTIEEEDGIVVGAANGSLTSSLRPLSLSGKEPLLAGSQ